MPTTPDLRVLIADDIAAAGIERLRTVAHVDVEAEITAAQLLARISNYHALVVRSRTKVDAALLAAAAHLRVVGRAGVGVDNVDVAAAVARDVIVVNSPLAATTAPNTPSPSNPRRLTAPAMKAREEWGAAAGDGTRDKSFKPGGRAASKCGSNHPHSEASYSASDSAP